MENNVPKGCLPFDIEAVKKGAKVVTRDGREAVFKRTISNEIYPFMFEVDGNIEPCYRHTGEYYENDRTSLDLFLVDPNYMGTELPQEQPYTVTMIASLPEKQISNPEFEFKQEIAAQFVLDWLRKKDLEYEPAAQVIQKGLDEYEEFIKQSKQRFSTTQAPK